MPKGISDPILSSLKEYERDTRRDGKKAVLLTPQGGYFLYGNRFCSIRDYELEFQCDSRQISGDTVSKPLFITILPDRFRVVGESFSIPEILSLIFHIGLGEENELLRGILLAREQEVRLSLFCDAGVEELYRLSRKASAHLAPRIMPGEELQQYAESLRRKDLHGLAGLYLFSKSVKEITLENN